MKRGLLLVFITAIISGFSIFINKYGVSVINPNVFAFLKNALVALALTGLIFFLKDWRIFKTLSKRQWLLLLLIGLVGGSIPFLLFFKGLSLTAAAQGAFIHKTMFVYVAIFAVIFLKEKTSKNFLIGALLLLLGSLISLKALPTSFGMGDLLILSATLLWAVENIISKYVLKDLEGRTVAWARMFFGSIFILIYLTAIGQAGTITALNIKQIGWTIFTALLLFGYVMTWYSGLKHVPVSLAAAILMIGSPITTLLSLINGTTLSSRDILSGLLILTGLFVIFSYNYFMRRRKNYVRA